MLVVTVSVMDGAVDVARIRANEFHDVNFTTGRPACARKVSAQHSNCGPDSLAEGQNSSHIDSGNTNGRNSTASDLGNPNGLNMDSSNGRANLGSAFFRALVPVAPLKYRIAERAASTVVNIKPFSDMIFLASFEAIDERFKYAL